MPLHNAKNPTTCEHHDRLEGKLDKILEFQRDQAESLAAVKATLDTATVRRPEMYDQLDKIRGRVNKLIGGLSGLLVLLGGMLAYLLK